MSAPPPPPDDRKALEAVRSALGRLARQLADLWAELDRLPGDAPRLGPIREQIQAVHDLIASVLATRQRKRGPAPETLRRVAEIRRLRNAGTSWPAIDRRFGYTPGYARELEYRTRRRGY